MSRKLSQKRIRKMSRLTHLPILIYTPPPFAQYEHHGGGKRRRYKAFFQQIVVQIVDFVLQIVQQN